MRRIISALFFVVMMFSGCNGLTAQRPITLHIAADDIGAPLAEALLNAFEATSQGSTLTLQRMSHTAALDAVSGGQASAAVTLRTTEAGLSTLIAHEILLVVAHPQNPVEWVNAGALRELFAGSITTWETVGGLSTQVRPVVTGPESATRLAFEGGAMDGAAIGSAARHAANATETQALVSAIPGAVGLLPRSALSDSRLRVLGINEVPPSLETARSRTYPLVVSVGITAPAEEPNRDLQTFVDWCLSEEGQTVVRRLMLGHDE